MTRKISNQQLVSNKFFFLVLIKINKRNPVYCDNEVTFLLDLTESWEIITAEPSGSSLVFQHFLDCHTHGNILFDTNVFFRVPPVCTPCTALDLPAVFSNAQNNITALTLSSVKLSWQCPTIKLKEKPIIWDGYSKMFFARFSNNVYSVHDTTHQDWFRNWVWSPYLENSSHVTSVRSMSSG
jgi:hypothetical protein